MAVNLAAVLAGLGGLGNAFEVGFVADPGTALPTTNSAALNVGFKSMGIISADGVTQSTNMSTVDIGAYGTYSPVRTLISSEVRTFKVTGEETNAVTLALKARLSLASVVPTVGTGAVAITEGPARDNTYEFVQHWTDGVNIVRKVSPLVRVIGIDDEQAAYAANVAYGFTLQAYPDSSGVSVYSYYTIPSLG